MGVFPAYLSDFGGLLVGEHEHLLHPFGVAAESAEEHGDGFGGEAVGVFAEEPGGGEIMVLTVNGVAEYVEDDYLVVQGASRSALHRQVDRWLPGLRKLPSGRKVRWAIDIDPQEL